MRGPEIEERRCAVGRERLMGCWDLPRRSAPPFPLVVLVPDVPGRDRHGATLLHPRVRPFLEIGRALAREGLVAFRCDAPEDPAPAAILGALWAAGRSQCLVSRGRAGLVAFGTGAGAVLEALPILAREARPRGVVLVAPRGPLNFTHARGHALHVVFCGKDEEGCGAPARREDLLAEARHAGCRVATSVIEDADGAGATVVAGRAVSHPLLGPVVAHACDRLLRPEWEQDARPPGTAIGIA